MLATGKTYLRKLKSLVLGDPVVDLNISRHPERFNQDGTPRSMRFYSGKGQARGTVPEGTDDPKDSRQVRRRKIRVFLFNQISFHPSYGAAPRKFRRLWARKGRLQTP